MVALGAAACPVLGAPAPGALQPVDRDELSRMPATAQTVVAVSDVRAARATPAGQALESFLAEVGSWDRSRLAWDALGLSLGFAPGEAIAKLGSGRVLLVASGVDSATPMHALLGRVPAEVERRVRERLRPVPRGLEDKTPVLSLEGGAFSVATSLGEATSLGDSPSHADVLIAPRASRALFDSLLPVLAGRAPASTLASTPAWAGLASLAPGSIEALFFEPGVDHARSFALSGNLTGSVIDAEFVASPSMLAEPATHRDWPAHAVALLSRDALLMVAGSPGQDEPAQKGELFTHPDRTLLTTMLGNLKLTTDMRSHVRGVAIFAAQADPVPTPAQTPLALSAAVPVDDMAPFMASADALVARLAGAGELAGAGGPLAGAGPEAVRVLSVGAKELPLLAGAFGAGSGGRGAVAWGFVRSKADPDSGWWVLCVRGGESQEAGAVAGVQELCAALSEPLDAGNGEVFSLIVRPAELVARTAAANPGESRNALRWLTRVDTQMRRAPSGDYKGTIRLEMNQVLRPLPPPQPGPGKTQPHHVSDGK